MDKYGLMMHEECLNKATVNVPLKEFNALLGQADKARRLVGLVEVLTTPTVHPNGPTYYLVNKEVLDALSEIIGRGTKADTIVIEVTPEMENANKRFHSGFDPLGRY